MSQAILYHNPRCSKSRAALQLVEDAKQDCSVRRYLDDPPDAATLTALLGRLAMRPGQLIRTGEKVFKEHYADLDLEDDDACLQAMLTHPVLIQRPIFDNGSAARIGRPPEDIQELFS